jgi:hypothetical protein
MSGAMMADPAVETGAPAGPMDGMLPFGDVVAAAAANPNESPRMMRRDVPAPTEARGRFVREMQSDIESSKQRWQKDFDRMRDNLRLLRLGADPAWVEAGLYRANILQEHVNSRTARLYARNPVLRVDRRSSVDFEMWDGSAETLQAAAMDPMNPASAPLMQDVMKGGMRRRMMDGVARSLNLVAKHQIQQVRPPFKQSMKRTVARTLSMGVAFVKLGYERHMQPSPETMAQTANMEVRLAHIERLMADIHDPEAVAATPEAAEAEELRLAIKSMKSQATVVSDEGLRFDFPAPFSIIPDRGLVDLRGFLGCDRVTEEFVWTVEQIQEMFGVDVRGAGTCYYTDDSKAAPSTLAPAREGDLPSESKKCCVWMTYSRKDGLVYWSVKGYPDFLAEPAEPPVKLTRFWPWFALVFSQSDAIPDDEVVTPYPVSDVERMRHMQDEYNRSRQGLRDHRIAARPKAVSPRGKLPPDDRDRLLTGDAHVLVELDGLQPNEKIEDVVQWMKHPGIDPAMYDTSPQFQDIGRVVGAQGADMGNVTGATATEVSRAANSSDQASESYVDDLNTFLSEMFVEAGRVLLMEMDPATVKKIAGPGAQWPEIPTPDLFDGLYLDIQAGTAGRPNRMADLQALQMVAPTLLQIPGIKPSALAKEILKRLDENLDPADMILDGLPSIMAMAKMAGGVGSGAGVPGEGGPDKGPSDPGAAAAGAAGGGPNGQGGAANTPAAPGLVMRPPANPAGEPSSTVSGRGGPMGMMGA